MLSTLHQGPSVTSVPQRLGDPIIKPKVVVDYNKGKAGVDVSDQLATQYATRKKCVKWYQTLFCHVLDTTIVNACLVHRILARTERLDQYGFRRSLYDSLCGLDPPRPPPSAPPAVPVIPEGHVLEPCATYRRCVHCTKDGRRRVVKFFCLACNVGLHPGDCFNKHTHQ